MGTATILGTTYQTVTMPDGRIWMAENLNWDGLGTVGYYGNGRLYTYSSVSGVNFGHWRLPTPDEMFVMVDSVPGVSWWNGPYSSNARANFFRSTTWNGDNFSQMNFLPAGYYDGTLVGENESLMLCSPLDEANYTIYENGVAGEPAAMWLAGNDPYVYRKGALPTYGYSVRLIYDGPANNPVIIANDAEVIGDLSATTLDVGVTLAGVEDPSHKEMNLRVEAGSDSWWPNILTMQSKSPTYTIAQLQAPWQDDITVGDRESTLSLMRCDRDGSSEFLDLYNNHYGASKIMGLVIQKRGAGVLRNFYFGTWDGSNAQDAALIDNTNQEWKFWYPPRLENGMAITDNVPAVTTDKLYNDGGVLTWDGDPVSQPLTPTAPITANYSAAVGEFVLCNISGGSFTVTLPTAPADKSIIKVQIVKDGSSHSLTIQAGGSDTIGATALAGGATKVYGNLVFETATLQYQASVGVWRIEITAAPQNFAIGFPGIDAATPITANDVSIDYTTRVLTITPPLGYFNYYADGSGLITKFRVDGPISFPAFTDTSGVWNFHFDNTGTAVTTQTPWTDFNVITPVYRILWNATLTPDATKSQVENFEAHLNTISAADHLWKHTYGTIWVNGLDATDNRITSGSPNADGRNTVIGLSTGTNIDDNLVYTITNSTSSSKWNQDLGSNVAGSLTSSNSAQMKIRTQDGAGLTVMLDATRFPFAWNTGNNRPQYITATGVRTDVGNTNFFVYYVYATPDPRTGNTVRLTSATTEYTSITLARASTWADQQAIYPTLNDKEIRPLYKLIFEHRTSYDVATKYSALRQVDDLRKAIVTSATSIPGTVPATSVVFTPHNLVTSTNVQNAIQDVADGKINLSTTAPASASATGTTGEIRVASGFIYICVATNTWQRAAIATW